jgi:hypothetical protein
MTEDVGEEQRAKVMIWSGRVDIYTTRLRSPVLPVLICACDFLVIALEKIHHRRT